jgi:hypothetical protein
MQSEQPSQPPEVQPATSPGPAQPRAGWGRFWVGVLTGGCSVLLVELLVLLVGVFLIGSAVNSGLRQGGGSLPGGLPLPTGLPNLASRSDPCSPKPCVAHGGVTVLVGPVNRSAGSAAGGAHLVRVEVTFVDTSGAHTITPEEVAIRDSTGAMTLPGVDAAAATACGTSTASQDLQAGQRAGPFALCYAVTGAATAPLTLVWINPEDLALIEMRLP